MIKIHIELEEKDIPRLAELFVISGSETKPGLLGSHPLPQAPPERPSVLEKAEQFFDFRTRPTDTGTDVEAQRAEEEAQAIAPQNAHTTDMDGQALLVPTQTLGAPVQQDHQGTPYDPTLHSNPPYITKKGVWQKKRQYKHLQSVPGPAATLATSGVQGPAATFEDLTAKIAQGITTGDLSAERIALLPGQVGHADMTTVKDDPGAIAKAMLLLAAGVPL